MFIWIWGMCHFQEVKCHLSSLSLLDYSKMDIPNPPTSKCITYWKRKVKSEYMRLRQLKRLQANMGAKVEILHKWKAINWFNMEGLDFLFLSFNSSLKILTSFSLALLGSLCSKFCKSSRKNPYPQWRMEEASCPTCSVSGHPFLKKVLPVSKLGLSLFLGFKDFFFFFSFLYLWLIGLPWWLRW